jgi:hypothetical protein
MKTFLRENCKMRGKDKQTFENGIKSLSSHLIDAQLETDVLKKIRAKNVNLFGANREYITLATCNLAQTYHLVVTRH